MPEEPRKGPEELELEEDEDEDEDDSDLDPGISTVALITAGFERSVYGGNLDLSMVAAWGLMKVILPSFSPIQ
jgi:hypothetical protein